MDPDVSLKAIRILVPRMLAAYASTESNGIDQDDAATLAESIEALDEWLSKGGFLPKPWKGAKP